MIINGIEFEKTEFFELAQFEECQEYWRNSQYDLLEITASLMNRKIKEGMELLNIFSSNQFLQFANVAKFNFAKAKQMLGIEGDYVERQGDAIFSSTFQAKYIEKALKLNDEGMQIQAKRLIKDINKELEYWDKLGQEMLKKSQHDNNNK